MAKAFKLPSESKLLLRLAVLPRLSGAVSAPLEEDVCSGGCRSLRTALSNLREVAKSPSKLALLFGVRRR